MTEQHQYQQDEEDRGKTKQNPYIVEDDHISKSACSDGGVPVSSNGTSTLPHETVAYATVGQPATRKEVWSYYCYYAGNNGIGSFQ